MRTLRVIIYANLNGSLIVSSPGTNWVQNCWKTLLATQLVLRQYIYIYIYIYIHTYIAK